MLFPLDGRRVEVRERRTKVFSHVIKKLVDEDYPVRDRIVLVMAISALTSCAAIRGIRAC